MTCTRKAVFIYSIIFLTALVVRILYVTLLPTVHRFPDETHYDKLGVEISNTVIGTNYEPIDPSHVVRPYNHLGLARPPLYPIWLAGIYGIFGHNLTAVQVINGLLGAITALVAGLVASRIYGRRAGYIAGSFLTFYPITVFISRTLLVENLGMPLLVTSVLFAILTITKRRYKWAVLSGITAGLAALARANLLALIPFLVLGTFILIWKDRYLKKAIFISLTLILSTILTILPRFLDNGIRYNVWTPLTTTGWFNARLAFNDNASPFKRLSIKNEGDVVKEAEVMKFKSDAEIEAFYKEKTLTYIRENPGRSLYLYAGCLLSAFDFRTKIRDTKFANYLPIQDLINLLTYGSVLLLTLAGFTMKEVRSKGLPLFLIVIGMPFTLAFFHITIRYRVPIEPLMIILSAGTLVTIINRIKNKLRKES